MRFAVPCLLTGSLLTTLAVPALHAQTAAPFPMPLDAGRDIKPLIHTPLPEQYIWTDGASSHFAWSDQQSHTEAHWFRKQFTLATVPEDATLYIAGPRDAEVYVNGHLLAHFSYDISAPISIHVFHADATHLLHPGQNTIAIRAIRGRGVVAADQIQSLQQLSHGQILVVKLLAAGPNREGKSLLLSDNTWRSIVAKNSSDNAWTEPTFNDSSWPHVESLGGIESSRDFMQWSADAGMYAWPGYRGMSAPLGNYTLPPVAITHVFSGESQFTGVEQASSGAPITLTTPADTPTPTDLQAPAILVDFGREIAGRILVESASPQDAVLSIAYGESELSALATGLTPEQRGGNYLGTNLLEVPARGTARGPKSAFRYVRIRFLRGGQHQTFRILAEGIAYPVQYRGSFQSSDPLLNRIWAVGAYTAHLCMQDDVWDAPKRDRGRWAGDLDVTGDTISTAFLETSDLERTLASLATPEGSTRTVNGIPGYSALWLTTLANLYNHAGDLDFVRSQRDAINRVVASMDHTLGPDHLFHAGKGQWPFIDWAPDLYGATPLSTLGTSFQYIEGYTAAAMLLDRAGDATGATHAREMAAQLTQALQPDLAKGLGHTPQINALAVVSEVASTPDAREAIWNNTLSHVKQDAPEDPVISPYFNATVIRAMSDLGHRQKALDWIRTYWGGMLDEGATSFWESYDLRWPKHDYHLSLQADGTSGYFVSLAHGWSTAPTSWLSENVLGVRDPEDGFRTVTIAPHLLGLQWAKGTVPTPHGEIAIDARRQGSTEQIKVDLPAGIERAHISLDEAQPNTAITLDGHSTNPHFDLAGAGTHTISFTAK